MKFVLILALAILNTINGSKISNKNILLPLADIEVEYEVVAEGGCFDWSASNTAISVTGQDMQGCLKSIAKVRAITKTPSQTFIYVKEKNSDSTVFIVEVVVQEISKLSIITKQKQLDLDTQEELHVQAYDSKGNTFTTLEGLRFEWRLGKQDNKPGILEMVKFFESGLKVSEKRARLEFESDIIVVKGKYEGLVKVFTKVIEQKYSKQTIETDVDLVVIQKFQFSPDYPVYYLPTHSKIQFNLLRADGKTKIQLPSTSHIWFTSSKLSTIEQNGLLSTHQIENDLVLSVKNSEHNKIEAIYHVVNPKFIDIDIWEDGREKKEGKVTHLIVGRLYRFRAYLKDQNNQRIFSTNEYNYSSSDIQLIQQTVKSDQERQNIKLEYSWDTLKSSIIIHFVKPIEIITVFKTYIHLPIHEQYKLNVKGGSGQYRFQQKYFSPNIFEISNNDQMIALQTGENTLYIYDNLNIYNDLEIIVYVTDVSQILSYEIRKELLVNQYDDIYYQAIGEPRIGNYTQCRALTFSSFYDSFTITKQLPIDDNYLVCNGLNLLSSNPGQYYLQITTQRITYNQQVRVYGELYFEKPFYLITPHSTITTKVLGGPLPWDSIPFNENLTEGIIKIDLEKYHFNCYKQQATFIIKRVNKKSDLLPKPKEVSSVLPIKCLYPDAFKVYNEQQQEINWLFKDEKILINVIAVHNNIQFYNSSSLQLDYSTKGLIYQNRYLSFDITSGITNCKFIVSSHSHNNHKDLFSLIKTELDFIIHHTLKLIPNGEVYVFVDQSVLFQIESSTSQIECKYEGYKVGCSRDQVTITPKNTGQYQLIVYDLQLNYSVSATLIVVEPSQLNLELSQQITVVGKPINATSTFYYYKKLMHVTDWQSLKLANLYNFVDIKQINNQFIINPNEEGLFKLQTNYNSINSNFVDLKVIPKLTVETVYMPTQCETHVVFPSYPQFGYTADSINEIDASVSQNIVTIKSKSIIGEFKIIVYLKQQSIIIDAVTIPIIVNIPNRIDLKYGRKVELGSTVRVVAEFQIQNHQMNLCLCPTHKILWYQDDKLVQSSANQLGLSISTVVLGKINIRIEAYKQQAYTSIDVERLNSYNRNLFINTKAQYHIPLLIPPYSKLSLGQDIKSVDELKLHPPTIIESSSNTLQPNLLMAQTPMLIQVQEIYQMYPMQEFVNLKVDEKITIDIAYLNEQGYQFEDVENNLLELLGHTRHVVSIKINVNQLEIQGLDQGYALIKLNCGQNKHDYILIKVGATLLPMKAYLGSIITYTIDNAERPQWYSNCGDFKGNKLTITRELNECFVEANDQGNKFKAGLEVITPSHIVIESNRVDNYLHIKLNVNPKIQSSDQVNPNFSINVEIDQDDWFEITPGSTPYEYYIKPIISSNDSPMPKRVKINAFVKNTQIQLEGSKDIIFERDFQLPQKEIVIQNSSPIQILSTPYYRNIEKTHQDSHLNGLINTQYQNGKVEITFDFSQCQEPTEGNVYFENKQVIKVKFVKESSYEQIIFLAAIIFFMLVVLNYFR